MRIFRNLCGAVALLALVAPGAGADEWNKLTILTFSGPVAVPGMTLPAGTYRFQLADPESGRRVVKISNEDGSKAYGIFLSIPNERLKPADRPVVMFNEAPAGMPPAVKLWFYPAETFGYEFVYPRNQALQLARANHEAVLAWENDSKKEGSDANQLTAMRTGKYSRIDENGQAAPADSQASQPAASTAGTTADHAAAAASPSSAGPPPAATAATSTDTTTAANAPAVTGTTAATTPGEPSPASSTPQREPTGAVGTSGEQSNRVGTPGAVGTSGQVERQSTSRDRSNAQSDRGSLPKTASHLPWLMLFSGLALAGALTVHRLRRSMIQ